LENEINLIPALKNLKPEIYDKLTYLEASWSASGSQIIRETYED
jgi:hypothetical protein